MKDKNHTRKQTEIHDPYIKVGRISVPIARKAHIKAADIYVSKNQLKHIWNIHGNELSTIGIDAITLVKSVCCNFNQIRKGSGSSILLVIYDDRLPKVVAIDLNYSLKNEFWEVKTAEPRRCSTVLKLALIWGRPAKHSANGDGYRLN